MSTAVAGTVPVVGGVELTNGAVVEVVEAVSSPPSSSEQVPATSTTILDKPGNAANCREQLKLLSGSTAEFYTACTVRCVEAGVKLSHVDTTAVKLRPLSDAEIDRYIERERPFDCAGGFKAEALGITLFERIDTEDPTAIVGMPLIWLASALRGTGFQVP